MSFDVREQYYAYRDAIVKRNAEIGLETPKVKTGIASTVAAAVIMGMTRTWIGSTLAEKISEESLKGKYGSAESKFDLLGDRLILRDPAGKIVYSSKGVEPNLSSARMVAKEFVAHGAKPSDKFLQPNDSVVSEDWSRFSAFTH